MCETPHAGDLRSCTHCCIAAVSVALQIPVIARQQTRHDRFATADVVLETHHLPAGRSTTHHPHRRLALGGASGFLEHLHPRLIHGQDVAGQQDVGHQVDQWCGQITGGDHLAGQRLPRQVNVHAREPSRLSIQRQTVDELIDPNERQEAGAGQALRDRLWRQRRCDGRGVAGAADASLALVLQYEHLRGDDIHLLADHGRNPCQFGPAGTARRHQDMFDHDARQ